MWSLTQTIRLVAAVLMGFGVVEAFAQGARVGVEGADVELRDNIVSHLRVAGEACDASMARLNRLLPQVRAGVREAARALGYYHASFSAAFRPGEGCWSLSIVIDPGSPVLLDEVNVQVIGDRRAREPFEDLLRQLPLTTGDRLNHGEYERVKNDLSAQAVENGFFAARFTRSEVLLDLASDRADVHIEFEPGERYTFGEVTIDSARTLGDTFVRSLVPFQPGDEYSSAALIELRRNLDASQYFRRINISPQLALANGTAVPVHISLQPRPRHAWSAGAGFTTDTGPRLRLGYENRYLNQRGHRLGGDGTFSPVRSQANVNYRVPVWDPARNSLNFGGGFIHEDTDSFDSNRFNLQTSLRNESPGGWIRTAFINFQRDDFTIDVQENTSILTMPGVSFGKTGAADPINPTRGWRLFSQVRGAADNVLSDVSFVQFYGAGKGVIGVGRRGRFLARFEAGLTLAEATRELPVSVRFFTGGDQSVRGYDFQSLGPLNENGEVTGGRHLLAGSIEYDFHVNENWRVAAFFDGGNAFSRLDDFDWKTGAGIGLRWLSPLGPIRLDLAHGFQAERDFRVHITMGPDL